MEFIHPSVRSKIIDNSITFVTAQGITQLYLVFTSDTGPDNKITRITSPSEWIFHYGNPNMRKHGQAAYNALNWLNSHGGIFALRVMPDDAGFSHAIVNIQSKESQKNVLDVNGDVAVVPNVTLRTVAAFSDDANVTEAALETFVKTAKPKTVDGFKNHMLFAAYPKGRGKAYDNLGFIMTLNDTLNATYPFRLYNFEVVKILDSGALQTIDGPFLVSMDPDAVSISQESMHIKYVVEKYGQYLNIIFNEEAYDALGEIVNPHVNPQVLDFFGGVTRVINELPETYFEPLTRKDEDVHLSLLDYEDSVATGAKNFVDTASEVEQAVVLVDNGNRLSEYETRLVTVENQKYVLNRFRAGAFQTAMDLVAKVSDSGGTYVLDSGELEVAMGEFDSAHAAYLAAEDTYNTTPALPIEDKQAAEDALKLAGDYAKGKLATMLSVMHKALDYARAIRETEATLNTLVNIFDISSGLDAYEIVSIKSASKKGDLIAKEAELTVAKTEGNSEKMDAVKAALSSVKASLRYANSIQMASEAEADPVLVAAATKYNNALTGYKAAIDPLLLASELDGKVNAAVTLAEAALAAAKSAVSLATIEEQLYMLKESESEKTAALNAILVAVFEASGLVAAATTTELKKVIEEGIIQAITNSQQKAVIAKTGTYTLFLKDYSQFIQFAYGSDGAIDESKSGRATAIDNLLIKGYKGLIDDNLLNKKEWPIDLVLDANYSVNVKNAIVDLCTKIRDDFMGIVDTGFQATPQQSIDFRRTKMTVSNFRISIFTQDFLVYDEFLGQDIKVTSTYFLSKIIPANDEQYGLHWNFVGPRRGTIDGFKKMSYNPTEAWKEELYKKQINYIEQDPKRVNFGSQLTSQTVTSALSNLHAVRAILRMQREIEELADTFRFEWNDNATLESLNGALQGYLRKWVDNRCCDSISGEAYASDYDRKQKIARIRVQMVFNGIIERIFIDLVVNG